MMTSACQPAAAPSDLRGPSYSGLHLGIRAARSASLFLGNSEPPLDEVMRDPVVRRLMDRDGVGEDSLLSLIEQVRSRLR